MARLWTIIKQSFSAWGDLFSDDPAVKREALTSLFILVISGIGGALVYTVYSILA